MALRTSKISTVIDSINGAKFNGPTLTYTNTRDPDNPITYSWTLEAPRVRHWLGVKCYDWSFWWITDPSVVMDDVTGLAQRWSDYVADNKDNWGRIFDAMMVEYDPVYNYDRYEEGTDSHSHNGYKETLKVNQSTTTDYGNNGYTESHSYNDTHSESWRRLHQAGPMSNDGEAVTATNLGRGSTETFAWSDDNVGRQVAQNDIRGADVEIDTGSANSNTTSNEGNNSTTRSGKFTVTETTGTNGNTKEIAGGTDDNHDWHIYGNIGVTTAQQMITEELKLRAENMTKIIMEGFCREYLALLPETGDEL